MHVDGIQTIFARNEKVYNYRFRGNQWLKGPGPADFFPLYLMFYNIAKTYDRFKGVNVNAKDYLPTLQIRNLSKKDNMYRFILVIILIYCLIQLFSNRSSFTSKNYGKQRRQHYEY
jgi:hypothetical protein